MSACEGGVVEVFAGRALVNSSCTLFLGISSNICATFGTMKHTAKVVIGASRRFDTWTTALPTARWFTGLV